MVSLIITNSNGLERPREDLIYYQWGTFCYKFMSFGLKNKGATYQRAMTTLFHDTMHKEMKVNFDDITAKFKTEEDHIVDLKKIVVRLRKYDLKLNPNKCVFHATSGKLLGFIVSQRGIKIDPLKIKAITKMSAPKTEKEVRFLLGRINYISSFIPTLATTCAPVLKLLSKNVWMVWKEGYQIALENIRRTY